MQKEILLPVAVDTTMNREYIYVCGSHVHYLLLMLPYCSIVNPSSGYVYARQCRDRGGGNFCQLMIGVGCQKNKCFSYVKNSHVYVTLSDKKQ